MMPFGLFLLFVGVAADVAPPKPPVHRIVGGHDVDPPFSIPFIAAIVDAYSENSNEGHFCGATIIGPKRALTAAHCVHSGSVQGGSQPAALEVWRHDLSVPAMQERPSHADIMERNPIVAVHRYHPYSDEHDVAVLELEREYPSEVYSMVILNQDSTLDNHDGKTVTAIGWGATDMDMTQYPNKLQRVHLDILNVDTCSQLHQSGSTGGEVKSFEVCARSPGKDGCVGDSGGPLYKSYEAEGSTYYVIIGVTSWGPMGCAWWDEPGVWASVADHYQFITTLNSQDPPPGLPCITIPQSLADQFHALPCDQRRLAGKPCAADHFKGALKKYRARRAAAVKEPFWI
jgi:secreted trypsin-like serine protease